MWGYFWSDRELCVSLVSVVLCFEICRCVSVGKIKNVDMFVWGSKLLMFL